MPTNKEVMSDVLKAIHENKPEQISSILNEISAEQRAELCTESFAEYPGLTPLMALTVMTGTLGIGPLRALMKDVSLEKRLEAIQATIPTIPNTEPSILTDSLAKYQGRDITTILAKKVGRDPEVIEAFVEGFSDDNDKRKIMKPIKVKYIDLLDEIMQEREASQQASAQQTPQAEGSPASAVNRPLTRFASQSKNRFTTSAEYTDLFKNIDIALPEGKRICLLTEVAPDGIGDLVHQVRAFEVLNQVYPGKVDCYTYCAEKHLQTVNKVADEYQFKTKINPRKNEVDDPSKYALAVDISYQQAVALKKVSTYTLNEIENPNTPPYRASKKECMGLPPRGVGMWHDIIPVSADPAAQLNSSPELKKAFGCEGLDGQGVKNWLDHAWVAQSFQYSKDSFVLTLFAQLDYIKNKNLPIEHVFIKFFGKDRNNNPWDLKSLLNDDKYRQAFSDLNVKSIVIDNEAYLINENNPIELRMSSKRISHESYPAFQQLINGIVLPAGDNSYSEAWSNPNTTLPPFLELRTAKRSLMHSFEYVINTIPLEQREHDFLKAIIEQNNQAILYEGDNNRDLVAEAHQLSLAWSNSDSPHEVWLAVYEKIKEYDLNHRLPAIIKEQLFFALKPEIFDQKNIALSNSSSEGVSEQYLQKVEQALDGLDQNESLKL